MIELKELTPSLADRQLVQFVERHGADGCRLYLEGLRWPGGVECPRCTSGDLLWLEERRRHHCRSCRYQFRVTARTVFHDSHLPLAKWFVAIALMLASEDGISAMRLRRVLGGSYKTAWFLEHRIRAAMAAKSIEPGWVVAYAPPSVVLPASSSLPGPPAAGDEAGGGGRDVAAPANWPLLRSLIAGTHRNLSIRYLSAYWNEVRWRDVNRRNPHAFRDTVLALLEHPWLPYEELTGGRAPLEAGRR